MRAKGVKRLALLPAGVFEPSDQVQAIAEGAILATYEPDAYKTEEKEPAVLEELLILADARHRDRAGAGPRHRRSAEFRAQS